MESFQALKIMIAKDAAQSKTMWDGTRVIAIERGNSEIHCLKIIIMMNEKMVCRFWPISGFCFFLLLPWSGVLKRDACRDNQLNTPGQLSYVPKRLFRQVTPTCFVCSGGTSKKIWYVAFIETAISRQIEMARSTRSD